MPHPRRRVLTLEMHRELGETTDIPGRNQFGPRRDHALRLLRAERRRDFRLIQIVGACTAAAEVRVREFLQFQPRNGAQQITRLAGGRMIYADKIA